MVYRTDPRARNFATLPTEQPLSEGPRLPEGYDDGNGRPPELLAAITARVAFPLRQAYSGRGSVHSVLAGWIYPGQPQVTQRSQARGIVRFTWRWSGCDGCAMWIQIRCLMDCHLKWRRFLTSSRKRNASSRRSSTWSEFAPTKEHNGFHKFLG